MFILLIITAGVILFFLNDEKIITLNGKKPDQNSILGSVPPVINKLIDRIKQPDKPAQVVKPIVMTDPVINPAPVIIEPVIGKPSIFHSPIVVPPQILQPVPVNIKPTVLTVEPAVLASGSLLSSLHMSHKDPVPEGMKKVLVQVSPDSWSVVLKPI